MDVAFRFGLQKKKRDRLAAPRGRRAPHGRGQRAAALRRAAHRVRGADRLAGGGPRLRQGRRLPARLAGRRWCASPTWWTRSTPWSRSSRSATCRRAARPRRRRRPASAWATCPGRRRRRCSTPDRVVVLPLGAGAKEHGPHLPLRNDEILADYLRAPRAGGAAGRAAADADLRLLPGVPRVPGLDVASRSTRSATRSSQIVRSIARHGPRRFYVLNTGVSTARPLKAAAELLARGGHRCCASPTSCRSGKAAEDAVREQKYRHARGRDRDLDGPLHGAGRGAHGEGGGGRRREPSSGPLTRDRANGRATTRRRASSATRRSPAGTRASASSSRRWRTCWPRSTRSLARPCPPGEPRSPGRAGGQGSGRPTDALISRSRRPSGSRQSARRLDLARAASAPRARSADGRTRTGPGPRSRAGWRRRSAHRRPRSARRARSRASGWRAVVRHEGVEQRDRLARTVAVAAGQAPADPQAQGRLVERAVAYDRRQVRLEIPHLREPSGARATPPLEDGRGDRIGSRTRAAGRPGLRLASARRRGGRSVRARRRARPDPGARIGDQLGFAARASARGDVDQRERHPPRRSRRHRPGHAPRAGEPAVADEAADQARAAGPRGLAAQRIVGSEHTLGPRAARAPCPGCEATGSAAGCGRRC